MILFVTGLNNLIFNIDFYLFVDHGMEEGSHGLLICCPFLLETKGHEFVAKYALRGSEGNLQIVFYKYLYLIVAQEFFHEGHHFVSGSTINKHINVG